MGDSADNTIRVLLVDDHEILTASLVRVLDSEPDMVCVGVAGTLRQGRSLVPGSRPDVILLDHRLPDGDGVEAIGDLLRLRPSASIVVLTATAADHVLLSAVQAGAAGFVSKSRGLGELVSAIRSAAAGDSVISPQLLARLLARLRPSTLSRADDLTEREREVLGLLAQGLSNAAMAEALTVSVHTVRNHVANLSAKLGAHSKLEALSIAVRSGLLPGA